MADAVWISVDGNGGNAGSWSTGAVPGDNDTMIFNGTSSVPWTTGLTLAGGPTLMVTSNNTARIGLPGNGLRTAVSVGSRNVIRGRADVYWDKFTIVGNLVIDMDGGICTLGQLTDDATTVTTLFIKGGQCVLGPSVTGDASSNPDVNYLYIDGITAHVTIEQLGGGAGPTWEKLHLYDGLVFNKRDFTGGDSATLLMINGGELFQTGALVLNMHILLNAGRMHHAPKVDPSGDSVFWLVNGTLDLRDSRFAIPALQVVRGRRGIILGSAIETNTSLVSLDLADDLP